MFPIAALTTTAAGGILALTLTLILWRPRGLSEAWAAVLGALLALSLGFATLSDVYAGVRDMGDIMLFLISVMAVSGMAEQAGVFRWAAGLALVTARGRGWLLFVNLFLLGALITLFLSLDVTAVVLTPLVCALVLPLRLDARPFVFASAFVANTASLALPMSNLTNMLVYELLGVGFWDFVRYLALPNLVALAVCLALLLALFWRALPGRLTVTAEQPYALPDTPFFRSSLAIVLVTVVLLLAAGLLRWPFWLASGPGAVLLAVLAIRHRWLGGRDVRKTVAWELPPFVLGMYVVVAGVYRALEPVLAPLAEQAAHLSGATPFFWAVFASTAGANAVNNLPFSLAAIQFLQSVPLETVDVLDSPGARVREMLAFGMLLGVNLGPNLTVTGSLATMLCLASARRQGIVITPMAFIRTGVLVTPPMLAAAAVTLWAMLRLP
jgi:arsenical pump membrane protein